MAHNQKAEALAQRLRVLRAEKGLSLTEVAELTKVHRDTVSALERGKRHPYKPTLKKLARVYGVPLGELMEPEAVSDEAEVIARRVVEMLRGGGPASGASGGATPVPLVEAPREAPKGVEAHGSFDRAPRRADESLDEFLRRRYGLEPDPWLGDLPPLFQAAEDLGIYEEYEFVYMDLLRAEQELEDKHGERMIGPTYAVEFVCHLMERVVELRGLIKRLPGERRGEASERQDLDGRAREIRERVRKLLEREIEEVRARADADLERLESHLALAEAS